MIGNGVLTAANLKACEVAEYAVWIHASKPFEGPWIQAAIKPFGLNPILTVDNTYFPSPPDAAAVKLQVPLEPVYDPIAGISMLTFPTVSIQFLQPTGALIVSGWAITTSPTGLGPANVYNVLARGDFPLLAIIRPKGFFNLQVKLLLKNALFP